MTETYTTTSPGELKVEHLVEHPAILSPSNAPLEHKGQAKVHQEYYQNVIKPN